MTIQVTLIAVPHFLDPGDLAPRADQLLGTDAEKIVEVAGRTCYDSFGKGRNSGDYHDHVLEVDHGSVTEHVQFTLRLRGISRPLANELVRHRVGVAISQRSTRYVDETLAPICEHPGLTSFYTSPDVSDQEKAEVKAAIEAAVIAARCAYAAVNHAVKSHLMAHTIDKVAALKQARGAARFYLPTGVETEMIWSANIRAMRHVIFMRASNPADAEIRELAIAVLRCVREQAPAYFGMLITFAGDGLGLVVDQES